MMKRLLFGVAMMALVCSAGAQTVISKSRPVLAKKSSKVVKNLDGKANVMGLTANKGAFRAEKMAAPFALTKAMSPMNVSSQSATRAGEDRITGWWGLPMSDDGSILALGWDILAQVFEESSWTGKTDYNIAVYLPSNYRGAIIDSVSFAGYNATYSNIKVWFNTLSVDGDGGFILPETPEQAAHCVSLDGTYDLTGTGGYMDFALPEGQYYTVPDEGCVIGMSFVSNAGSQPVVSWATDALYEGSYLFQFSLDGQTAWQEMNYLDDLGNLTILAHLDITDCPQTNVSVQQMYEMTGLVNQETEIAAMVTNDGLAYVDSVAWVLTVDGVEQPVRVGTFSSQLSGGESATLLSPYTFTEEGVHTVSLEVVRVNGQPNVSTSASTDETPVVILESAAKRTHVVEVFTATGCSQCPRSHVGMEKFAELYGDDVVVLAGHQNFSESYPDPMHNDDYLLPYYYSAYYLGGGGLPSAAFDRLVTGDPYVGPEYGLTSTALTFGADAYLPIIEEVYPSEASISLEASWADDARTSIDATVKYNFGYDRLDAPYGIAFVLAEDGMSGTTAYWSQANACSGNTNYPSDFTEWILANQYATGVVYNNVVVDCWDVLFGADGSIEAPISKGFEDTYTRNLSIADNTVIQNKDNLRLVAMLINLNNGSIVNAAQVRFGNPAGIAGVGQDKGNMTEVARYNANGLKLAAPAKGLNIVKYSDGSIRKMIVK